MVNITCPEFKEQNYVIPLFQVGGSALTNMPANDGVEVISDSASDVNMITIFGTDFDTNALTYETVTMLGTSQKATTKTDWGSVYGFFLGDIYGKNSTVAVGTITVREASGNAEIGTLAAGERSTGSMAFKVSGVNILVHNISGVTYANSNNQGIYPTTNNSFKYTAQQADDIRVNGDGWIYLLGDATGSTAQIKVYR